MKFALVFLVTFPWGDIFQSADDSTFDTKAECMAAGAKKAKSFDDAYMPVVYLYMCKETPDDDTPIG